MIMHTDYACNLKIREAETIKVKKFKQYIKKIILGDSFYLHKDVQSPQFISHQTQLDFLAELGNKKGLKILEVGSREVTGKSNARKMFSEANYTGFDFYAGDNVDIVGDAHKLSSYFPADESFDIIYSSACFEHFAMPWLVAEEINKLLKIGGYVFIETHFSFSSHERPWHFFQYSDMGLKVLFSPAMGYECIDAGMSNPIIGRFSKLADKYLRNKPVTGLYCHSEFLGKKVKNIKNFSWNKCELSKVVENTKYRLP